MQEVNVRPETPEDVRAIDVVHMSAFAGEAEASLVHALRGAQRFVPELSFVAEIRNRIVGHAMLSRAQLRRREDETDIVVLGPMSVVPSQSHRGIGSALVKAAIERARSMGFEAMVVAGFPDYYARFGFEPAAQWNLTCSLAVPEYAVTAMELVPNALAQGGQVVYPPEFKRVFTPG